MNGKAFLTAAAVTLAVGAVIVMIRRRAQEQKPVRAAPPPIPVELLSIDVDIAEPVLRF